MKKPIIQAICNNMGTILVIRSPRNRQWLFNLSISIALENSLITLKGHAMKTLMISALLSISLILCACETPTKAQAGISDADYTKVKLTSLRYLQDTTTASCYYPTLAGGDSLIVDKKRYTISSRSRYRVEELPHTVLTQWRNEDLIQGDWAIYRDTKIDSIYVFSDCITVMGE